MPGSRLAARAGDKGSDQMLICVLNAAGGLTEVFDAGEPLLSSLGQRARLRCYRAGRQGTCEFHYS